MTWLPTLASEVREGERIDVVFEYNDSQGRPGTARRIESGETLSGSATVVHLVAMPLSSIDAEGQIVGVCGRTVKLPADWKPSEFSTLLQGVATGDWRPEESHREQTLQTLRPVIAELRQRQAINQARLPSDAVGFIDSSQQLHVAFDWNCDLTFSSDECYRVTDEAQVRDVESASVLSEQSEVIGEPMNTKITDRIPLVPAAIEVIPKTVLAAAQSLHRADGVWFPLPEHTPRQSISVNLHRCVDQDSTDRKAFRVWAFSAAGWRSAQPYQLGAVLEAIPRVDWVLVVPQVPAGEAQEMTFPFLAEIARAGEESSADQLQWITHYDVDPMAALVEQRIELGTVPEKLVSDLKIPNAETDSLTRWRNYLVTIDHPRVRKQHLDRVVNASEQVMRQCLFTLTDRTATGDTRDSVDHAVWNAVSGLDLALKTKREQLLYAWLVDAAYRRVRAIGYRELPDVVTRHPIKDWDVQNAAYESAYRTLCHLVPINDWRFVLTRVRFERRRGNAIKAYRILVRYGYQGPAIPWYFKKERDLWTEAGDEALSRLGHARWFLKEAGLPVTH